MISLYSGRRRTSVFLLSDSALLFFQHLWELIVDTAKQVNSVVIVFFLRFSGAIDGWVWGLATSNGSLEREFLLWRCGYRWVGHLGG